MATVTNLQDLEIWRLARSFSKDIGIMLRSQIFENDWGLKRQMLDASGSIMDNIAEGFGRGSRNGFINHLTIARGSLEEVRSQLFRCFDNQLIGNVTFLDLIKQSEVLVKRITALVNYLNTTPIKGVKFKNRS